MEPQIEPADGPLWRVARHLGVYGVGSAISLVSSAALLPIFATQFSAKQFGVVATGQIASLAAITIARLGLNSGMFRFLAVYHTDGDTQGADRAVTTALIATFFSSLLVTLAMFGALALIGSRVSADLQLNGALIAANVVLSAPRETAEFALQAKQHSRSYVVFTSTTTILTTVLTAVLALLFHGGAVAVFTSALVANSLMSLVGLIILRPHLKISAWSREELRREARFGVVGVPALLADWVMQFSDRLFLTRFVGLAQVGVYSLGYRIGLIEAQILGAATSSAWSPFVLSEYREPDGSRTIGRVATYFAIAGMGLVLFISASGPLFLLVIHARAEYQAANSVIFLIAFANFFAVMQHIFSTPPMIRLRPEWGTLFRLIGAGVNVALNFALIPTFGMLGAAWSTLATFVITALITEVVGRKFWRIAYEYRKLVLIVAGGVVIQLLIDLSQRSGTSVPMALSPLWSLVLFAGWLLATGSFSLGDARALARRLRRAVAA
jgi:O-antigen/teichoic acid export membrane protein